MVLKSDKEKFKTLLAETIRLLCKNGLNFKAEFSVEALVGITLDKNEEFFLSINETVKSDIWLPKADTSRPAKESHRSANKDIKGEPGQLSSCQRKRASETVTNVGGSSELPNLSLGDMQEGEQSFWSSVTGSDGEGGEGANQSSKRAKIEASEDDSSSNVIEIKGEPGSESEQEEEGGDTNQTEQSGGDASGSYTYATPVSSAQEMMGSNMSQVWEQLPPFSSIPGPSGVAPGMAVGVNQDGQQKMYSAEALLAGQSPFVLPAPRSRKLLRRPTSDFERVVQKILLSKGPMVTPRIVNSILSGRNSVSEIADVMRILDREGLGEYFDDLRTRQNPGAPRKMFIKKAADEIMDDLERYGISPLAYEEMYYTPGRIRF